MNIVDAMIRASSDDVKIGEVYYRVRRITTADLVAAGVGMLLTTPKATPEDAEMPAPMTAEQIAAQHRFADGVVCAGVQQMSSDGEKWFACTVVMDRKDEGRTKGAIYVGSLPPNTVSPLASAILSLTSDGGAAAERIASFLGG